MVFFKVKKQRNFPKGRTAFNVATKKKVKVIGIGSKTAIELTKTGKTRFISAKNLRLKR